MPAVLRSFSLRARLSARYCQSPDEEPLPPWSIPASRTRVRSSARRTSGSLRITPLVLLRSNLTGPGTPHSRGSRPEECEGRETFAPRASLKREAASSREESTACTADIRMARNARYAQLAPTSTTSSCYGRNRSKAHSFPGSASACALPFAPGSVRQGIILETVHSKTERRGKAQHRG